MNEPFNPELENVKIISTGNPASNEQNSSDENIEVLETLESAPSEKKSKHKISVKTITRSIAFKFAVVLFIFLAFSFTTLSFFLVHSIAEDNTETYTNFSTTIAERTADGLTYWLDSFSKSFGIFTNSEAFTSGDYELACNYLTENKDLIDPSFDFIGIADQDGRMYDSNGNYTDISH